jgi:hypothetical protein
METVLHFAIHVSKESLEFSSSSPKLVSVLTDEVTDIQDWEVPSMLITLQTEGLRTDASVISKSR